MIVGREDTYAVAEDPEDWVTNASRIVQVQRLPNGGEELLVRVFLWDLALKDLWLFGQGMSSG